MPLLFFIGVLLIPFTIGSFTLYIWLKAIILLCQGRFIAGSLLLCVGIAIVNFIVGDGTSFIPLYSVIIGTAIIAQAWKHGSTSHTHIETRLPNLPQRPHCESRDLMATARAANHRAWAGQRTGAGASGRRSEAGMRGTQPNLAASVFQSPLPASTMVEVTKMT
jgi:hypothetical protein